MRVTFGDLYLIQGNEIKAKMRKGERVVISFGEVRALGESAINDLKEFVVLPNVEVVDTTRYIDRQLGIKAERSVSQMELF